MLDLIYDRTVLDVQNRTAKGFYNASDLNRVESACITIAAELTSYGYAVTLITGKTDWTAADFPTVSDMERIRANVSSCRKAIALFAQTPVLPSTLEYMDYNKANALEKILHDAEQALKNITESCPRLGDFQLGGY